VTPASSVSPSSSSSFLPKILRESFSRLLHRSGRAGAQETDCDHTCCQDQTEDMSSSTSPDTEQIVKESLRNGLPIIPFGYPTFFTTIRRQEVDSKLRRKSRSWNILSSKHRPLTGGSLTDCEDEVFHLEHEEKGGGESLQTLDSIVQMAKLQMEDEPLEVRARQDSQGSYVEMSPHTEGEVSPEEGQYFCMDNTKLSSSRRDHASIKEKGELIENGFCRRFKKSKRHKEDYALFDFEGNSDYVQMAESNKKWHFLDFSRKSK